MTNDGEQPLEVTAEMLAPQRVLAAAPDPYAGRVDFERGMSYAPPVTLALVLACAVVFGFELATGALADEASIVAAGALHRPSMIAGGEWWRVGSAMFLHGGVDHLLGNLLALYVVGMALEHATGRARMATTYAVAGITGGLASVAAHDGPSVGASGAIFGVMAAVVAFLVRHRARFYVRDARIGTVLAGWAAFQLVIGFVQPHIDNVCHLGGLLGGAALGFLLPPRRPDRPLTA